MTVVLPLLLALLGVVAASGVLAPVLSRRPLPAVEIGEPPGPVDSDGGRKWSAASVVLVLLVVLAVAVPLLAGTLTPREPGAPITGRVPGPPPLEFLERRVRDHPGDPAARLDLADAYLARGRVGEAVEEYLALVSIDPASPDAHARLGLVLLRAGRPEDALRAVDRALDIDPSHPEALFERGVILLRGLDRPAAGAASFHRYLEAAPFGSHRSEARALLRAADRLAARGVG